MVIDVSIIIVNYHTSDLIGNCLNSIEEKSSGINFEIIIVDNHSETDFEEKIKNKIPERMRSYLRCISLPENIGFGKANNEGIKISKGRNILFLNPDTLLLNNAIKILSDFIDNNPEAGACGGNLLDMALNPNFSFRRLSPGIKWEINELLNNYPDKLWFGKNRNYNYSCRPLPVSYITGADLMVRHSIIKEIGGFRNEFFMFYEETDLCKRIRHSGWKIYNVPEAQIIHLEGQSFDEIKGISAAKVKMIESGRNTYYRLNHSPFQRKLSDLIYRLFLRSRIVLLKKGIKRESYRQRLKAHRL